MSLELGSIATEADLASDNVGWRANQGFMLNLDTVDAASLDGVIASFGAARLHKRFMSRSLMS